MEVVVFATHVSGYYESLCESAKRNGYTLRVIGMGKEWKGFMDKFYQVRNALSEQPDDKIWVVLDGFDTLVLRKQSECVRAFQSLHQEGKVLVSTYPSSFLTRILFGDAHRQDHGHALQMGMYMGYCKDLKQLFKALETYMKNTDENDQRVVAACYLDGPCAPYLQLDTRSQIFYNLEWDGSPSRFLFHIDEHKAETETPYYSFTPNKAEPLHVKRTGTSPFFLQAHANIDGLTLPLHYKPKAHHADYNAYAVSTYRKTIWKKFMSLLCFVLHAFICYLMLLHAFFTHNPVVLLSLLWLQVVILVQWYLIGGCFISYYEMDVHGSKKKNSWGGYVSTTALLCEKYLHIPTEHYDMFMAVYPIFYVGFMCVRLFNILQKCRRGKNRKSKQ